MFTYKNNQRIQHEEKVEKFTPKEEVIENYIGQNMVSGSWHGVPKLVLLAVFLVLVVLLVRYLRNKSQAGMSSDSVAEHPTTAAFGFRFY